VQLQGGQLSRCIRIANGDLTAAQLVAAPQGTPAGHDLSTIATDVAEQNGSDR
jgi:hypothetical protein